MPISHLYYIPCTLPPYRVRLNVYFTISNVTYVQALGIRRDLQLNK